jgi:hypothetical protein
VNKTFKSENLKEVHHTREDNIKLDFNKIGSEGVGWIQLAEDKFWVWAAVNVGTKFVSHKACGMS